MDAYGSEKLKLPEEADFDVEKIKSNNLHKKSKGRLIIGLIVATLVILMVEVFCVGYMVGSHPRVPVLPSENPKPKKLLLISIDGFRFDYIMRGKTPNLVALARHAYVSRLIPQFPSYTFPNHYSIVTGLYPESHGIVSNAFYDPSSERYFYFSDSSSTMHSNFWNAEPIWSTNQDQGGKSVVLHYPGSDVEIQGKRPFKFEPFAELPSFNRTKKMIQWLDDNPDANLAILYYDDVDHAGHVHGPDSDQVNRALQEVDAAIGDLIFKLKQRNCFDDYNIVIVSDHGMTRASNARRITLDRLIPNLNSMVAWSDFGPVASFIPKSGQEQRLGKALKRAIRKHHLPVRMYTKETMPSAYQYSKNDRIPPFVLEAKAGWSIDSSEVSWHPKGQHGYGRGVRDMDGIFIGSGEAFRKNAIPTFPFHSNLDVYPLMCQLLGIEPKPNNGTMQLSMKAIGTADLQATE